MAVCRSRDLAPSTLDEIWALTARYVETERAAYEKKLHALPEIGLFRAEGGALVGITSVEAYDVTWEGRRRRVIFTSNVVVDEAYRKRNLPLRLGVRTFARERLRHPLAPIDWLFDTYSFKSYVLLPRYFAEFWPRRDRAMPPDVAAYVDHLARARYGDAWRPEEGVADAASKRLRPDTAPIGEAERRDPDIRFFDDANPGHREGEVLVCLVPLTLRNWVAVLGRAARKRRR